MNKYLFKNYLIKIWSDIYCLFIYIFFLFVYIVVCLVFGFRSLYDIDSVVIVIYDLYFRGDVVGIEFGNGG